LIRVLLADDQALLLDGLRVILGAEADIEVAGAARDGEEAIALARSLRPDIVLCDLRMPRVDGVEATRRITAELPGTRVIVLTTYDHDELVLRALQAGAAAYLLKDLPATELVHALRAVAGGQTILQPAAAGRILTALTRQVSPREIAPEPAERLTERETDVLRLMAAGLRNRDIADRLVVSEATVKTHVNNIFAKLGCRDRTEAVLWAVRHGLAPGVEEERP
jgi:DNA-binding NarL/FixJ family response regulator